jgi:hypothetical protein
MKKCQKSCKKDAKKKPPVCEKTCCELGFYLAYSLQHRISR